MSDETKALSVVEQARQLVITATGQLDFGDQAEIVNWAEVSEAIDPRGPQLKCTDILDQPFVIQKLHTFESAFPNGRERVYWVVGQFEDQRYFNTVLGGQAVCEEIDNIIRLNLMYAEARDNGDIDMMLQYQAVGAGKRPKITIKEKRGGKYGRYYFIERDVTPSI